MAVAATAHGDRRDVGNGSRGRKSKQTVAGNDRTCPNCGRQKAGASRGAGRAERSWYIQNAKRPMHVANRRTLWLSSSRRGQAHESNEKRKRNRQSDVHRQPPRPSARRQDLEEDRGRDHHHSLYSCQAAATFAGRSGVRVGVFTLGHVEDLWSSTWVGSVAMLGNIEDGTTTIEMIL